MSKYGNLISCLNEFGYVDGIYMCIEAAETIVELEKRCDELLVYMENIATTKLEGSGRGEAVATVYMCTSIAREALTKYRGVK